jgi:hypothetical protein
MIKNLDDDVIPYLGADLNASLGIRDDHGDHAKRILGPYGVAGNNPRGKATMKRLESLHLCSTTSFFQNASHSTWVSKEGEPMQIDAACFPFEEKKRVLKSTVCEKALTVTDHKPIVTTLKICPKSLKKT